MSRQVTTAQLWETIRNAGLASADDCRKWARGVSDALGKSIASDPEHLIAFLVKFGYLTPYQGNVIYQSLPDPLLLDGVRIEKSLNDTLGDNWYEGSILSTNAGNSKSGERVWVAALSMAAMSSPLVKAWPPSAAWAELHTRVNGPQLDHWRTSGATLQHLYATVQPWASKSLTSLLNLGPLHFEQSLRMVQDVAAGLQSLHDAGLVHGNLSLESILAEANGSFRLRRDPFFPPCSPYRGQIPSLIPHSHPLLAVAAPELALPDSLPSVQSDIYALGCIWYRSITGAWPLEPQVGSSAVSWGALHARVSVQAPRTLSEVAGKCLLYLIAKNPAARFPSAKAFLDALTTDSKARSHTNSEFTKDSPTVAPVVREPGSNYTTQASPSPVVDKPKVQQPALNRKLSDEKQASTGAKPPTGTRHLLQSDTPVVDGPKVVEDAVEKVASEIRGRRGRIVQRASPAPLNPKLPILDAGDQKSDPAWQSPPGPQQDSQSKIPDAPATLENPIANEETPTAHNPTPKKIRRKRPPSKGRKTGLKSKAKGKKGRPVWLLPALIAGSCFLLLGMLLILRNNAPGLVTIENKSTKPKSNAAPLPSDLTKELANNKATEVDPMSERFEIRPDDGKVPWAPPTVGPPCSTDLLPMGIETLVYISPRTWQHQGPIAPMIGWWNSLASEPRANWWPEISNASDSLEQITIAWYPGKEQGTARYVVRFAFKESRKVLDVIDTSAWSPKAFTGASSGSRGSIWTRNDAGILDAMLCDDLSASPNATTKYVTFGPSDLLETILATKETPFIMRRQLDMLRQASDSSSDIVLLVAPSFLFGDGKEILGADSPKILSLLNQVVDDKVQAFMLRAQWDKDWYLEWRSLGNDLQAAGRNANNVKTQIETASSQIEAALVTQPADPYWRAIANRFPQMLRTLAKWMRTGAEDGQVVVNTYLPQEAVSNLVIGSWMAAQRDWNAVASTTASAKPAVTTKNIDQWLDTPITLRIEQDSLENVLQAIATELKETSNSLNDPVPMSINGTAFQKDGITRNQQVRSFEYTNTPVRQVLTSLARRANPVTTVQAPNEKDQKVVWVILDEPSTPSKKKLEFTTRAWTDANKATLPAEFVLPSN